MAGSLSAPYHHVQAPLQSRIRKKRFLNESLALSSSAAQIVSARHSVVLRFGAVTLTYLRPALKTTLSRETLPILIKPVLFLREKNEN